MAPSPVLYALVRKRAGLAGASEEVEHALSVLGQKLQQVDGSFVVFGLVSTRANGRSRTSLAEAACGRYSSSNA